MGHAAVTDLTGKRHRFTEILYRAMPLLGEFGDGSGPLVAWSRPPAGSTVRWSLHWNGGGFDLAASDENQDFSFRLSTRGTKGPIFQGPNGYSIKGGEDGAASQYYSFTRMATRGRVSIGGEEHAVEGVSWMDKEFGSNQLGARQIGWDWFSLQLDDGRDLMLYLLRDRHDQVDFANGTLISREGQARYLESGDWSVRATGTWTSPHNGARYPAGWQGACPCRGSGTGGDAGGRRLREREPDPSGTGLLGGPGEGRVRDGRTAGTGVRGIDRIRGAEPAGTLKPAAPRSEQALNRDVDHRLDHRPGPSTCWSSVTD